MPAACLYNPPPPTHPPTHLQLLKRKNPAALDEIGLHAMRQLAATGGGKESGAGAVDEAGVERRARLVAASRLIQSQGGCCAVLCCAALHRGAFNPDNLIAGGSVAMVAHAARCRSPDTPYPTC